MQRKIQNTFGNDKNAPSIQRTRSPAKASLVDWKHQKLPSMDQNSSRKLLRESSSPTKCPTNFIIIEGLPYGSKTQKQPPGELQKWNFPNGVDKTLLRVESASIPNESYEKRR